LGVSFLCEDLEGLLEEKWVWGEGEREGGREDGRERGKEGGVGAFCARTWRGGRRRRGVGGGREGGRGRVDR